MILRKRFLVIFVILNCLIFLTEAKKKKHGHSQKEHQHVRTNNVKRDTTNDATAVPPKADQKPGLNVTENGQRIKKPSKESTSEKDKYNQKTIKQLKAETLKISQNTTPSLKSQKLHELHRQKLLSAKKDSMKTNKTLKRTTNKNKKTG